VPESRRHFLKLAAAGAAAPLTGAAAALSPGGAQAPAASTTKQGLRPRGPDESVVVCAGDLFLVRPLSDASSQGANAVFDVFRQADAGLANLENGLSTVGSPELGGFRHGGALRGAPGLAKELSWAGIKAVSLANNHTGNYGPDALIETMAALDAAGVKHAGAGRDITEAFAPTFVKAGNLTIALVSVYSFYYNFQANDVATPAGAGVAACRAYDVLGGSTAALDATDRDKRPYLLHRLEQPPHVIVAPLKEDVDRLCAAVKDGADRADFTIVSAHIHWGRHTKHDLPAHQRVIAHAAIDAGADLFVGHGPHTIRGVEHYRERLILYSLGNFVLLPPTPTTERSTAASEPTTGQRGIVARIAIQRRRIVHAELLPIVIDPGTGPQFAGGQLADRIVGGLYGLSAALGTDLHMHDWLASVTL
jgi:poly-gamma-glutamate capsule biosynthesis protein CapA/YwtB (metallophosphatase superfamily)